MGTCKQALHRAFSRLQSGGPAIGWADALHLPEEARCVCLVRAADKAHAVLARDTAGLPTARVQAARELSGRLRRLHLALLSDPR